MRRKSSAIMQTVRVEAGAPDGYDVLVLHGGYKRSLASARSLGRAGLRVAMGERFVECDPALSIPSFRSRYSAHNVVPPSYAADPAAFAAAVVEFVCEHPTRVVYRPATAPSRPR